MHIEIRKATQDDAISLAPRLKQADVDEVMASSGLNPLDALTESVAVSDQDMVWCATLNGRPEIIWGVRGVGPDLGGVWLLSSEEIMGIRRRFMQESIEYVRRMHTRYQILFNYVDIRNTVSLEWLRRLGFKFGEVVLQGSSYPFITIYSDRGHHV